MGKKTLKVRDRRGSTFTIRKNFALVGESGLGVALYILRQHGRRASARQRPLEGMKWLDYPGWAGAFVHGGPRKMFHITCP